MANSAPLRFMQKVPTKHLGMWTYTATAAEITAGKIIVPAVVGKQLLIYDAWFRGHGSTCSGPTTIALIESASSGVAFSHVAADLSNGTWRYTTAGDGTVVTTLLKKWLTLSEGLKLVAAGGSANTAMTTMDVVVVGFYAGAVMV